GRSPPNYRHRLISQIGQYVMIVDYGAEELADGSLAAALWPPEVLLPTFARSASRHPDAALGLDQKAVRGCVFCCKRCRERPTEERSDRGKHTACGLRVQSERSGDGLRSAQGALHIHCRGASAWESEPPRTGWRLYRAASFKIVDRRSSRSWAVR